MYTKVLVGDLAQLDSFYHPLYPNAVHLSTSLYPNAVHLSTSLYPNAVHLSTFKLGFPGTEHAASVIRDKCAGMYSERTR